MNEHIWLPNSETKFAMVLPLKPEKWDQLEATHPKVIFGKYLNLKRAYKAIQKQGQPIASKIENRGLYLMWKR
jgi:hypothetical protein